MRVFRGEDEHSSDTSCLHRVCGLLKNHHRFTVFLLQSVTTAATAVERAYRRFGGVPEMKARSQ